MKKNVSTFEEKYMTKKDFLKIVERVDLIITLLKEMKKDKTLLPSKI